MKLATLDDGSRDGHLAVVSRDLATAHFATGIAGTLQRVLDDWNFLAPQLQDLYDTLNDGRARHAFAFDPAVCMAPLPRAFERWQAMPDGGLHRVGSADALGPQTVPDAVRPEAPATLTPALAVVTGDVADGTEAAAALDAVRLLLLLGDWKPGRGCQAPVAVTPDELGRDWHGGRPHLSLMTGADARHLQPHEAAAALSRHFGEWIAEVAAAGRLRAGTVIGCPIEAAVMTTRHAGDSVYLEALAADGASVFGAIRTRRV
ncbi:MAG: fumarylacetoacetate hydrolase [Pseudomonadota bacterium]|nr:fumarylacetoacetate hydrolase [Pseudomonadota bacterium]